MTKFIHKTEHVNKECSLAVWKVPSALSGSWAYCFMSSELEFPMCDIYKA
jgi:hypothetical protein